MSYNDNDDDLFDYEPEDVITHTENNSSTTSQKLDNQLLTDIKDNFDDIEDKGSIKGLEARLGSAFLDAANFYVNSAVVNGHSFAARYVLDEVSDGKFSLLEYFKTTEIKILKMIEFTQLCESVLKDENSFVSQIQDLVGITLSPLHISSVYQTHLKLTRHSLLLNRAIYLQLSEQLMMPVIMELFDDNCKTDDINYSYSDLVSNIKSNIIKQYAHAGLLDKISEAFGSDVQLYQEDTQEDS